MRAAARRIPNHSSLPAEGLAPPHRELAAHLRSALSVVATVKVATDTMRVDVATARGTPVAAKTPVIERKKFTLWLNFCNWLEL